MPSATLRSSDVASCIESFAPRPTMKRLMRPMHLMRVPPLVVLLGTMLVVACHGGASMVPAVGTPGPGSTQAGPFDIAYRVTWDDPGTHLYDLQIDLGRVTGDVVKLQMPIWSPGRYAPFYFARNVTGFRASAGGAALRWERENGSLWRVYPNGASNVTIQYRVYANTLSGTFSILDSTHANWNGPSLFMSVVDHKPDPVRLHVGVPAGWHIVNGDARAPEQ